jgi:transaldolase
MKIYLDSADARSWSLPSGCPAVQGVTTNPTLVYQAGLDVSLPTYLRLLGAVADHGLSELMLQLPHADAAEALAWLDALRSEARRLNVALTIKLPCHPDWLACIDAMGQAGQDILLTGLSSPVQLLWAQERKARWVAPYVGRLVTDGRNVPALMEACVQVQSAGGPGLLAASIKSPDVLAQLIAWGAEAVTLPPSSLSAWSRDALTDAAIAQFERDIHASHKRAE